MKCAYFPDKGKELEVGELPIPEPKEGEVRIRVRACGVCRTDELSQEAPFPGISYPRIPGHEVAGEIDLLGPGVTLFKVGDKVGVGWFGGSCGKCRDCVNNSRISCAKTIFTGYSRNGGYAEYMVASEDALARIPEGLSFADAGPLLCAGITTFNGIRRQHVLGGGIVAIQGIGGLGHLGLQFANKMGYVTVAISGGREKEALARKLGAHHYIDSSAADPAKQLQQLGGADLILVTAPYAKTIEPLFSGLKVGGKIVIVSAVLEKLQVDSLAMLMARQSLIGWPSGDAFDSEDTLNFSSRFDVKAMIEKFPLEKAKEAYTRMITNKARFRCVLLPFEAESM